MRVDDIRGQLRKRGVSGISALRKPDLVKQLVRSMRAGAGRSSTGPTGRATGTRASAGRAAATKKSASRAAPSRAKAAPANKSAPAKRAAAKKASAARTTTAAKRATAAKKATAAKATTAAKKATAAKTATAAKRATAAKKASAAKATTAAKKASTARKSTRAGKTAPAKKTTAAGRSTTARTASAGKAPAKRAPARPAAKRAAPTKRTVSRSASSSTSAGGIRTGRGTGRSVRSSQVISSVMDRPERPGRSLITANHEVIKRWAQERGARPATIAGTERDGRAGVLTFNIPGYRESSRIREITWDEWFYTFDLRRLNLIYQEQLRDGRQSSFFRTESPDREDG
ncbi:hypothetical protein AB0B86_16820 [Micromonospora sp. NPDC049047]|uniref:hypothetical protein n=1 Tax=Micromonospora sp. NPDC049047 TaxID=3155645 RepID=UPI0033FE6839